VVRPAGDEARDQQIPLFVAGQHLADLRFAMYQELDHAGEYLKTWRTDFNVRSKLTRGPLLRLEYRSDMRTDPISHWQFHAERGAFSHLLSVAHMSDPKKFPAPHDLSHLHLPVGGERFRPCLEDLLELLIRDCGVDAVEGWESAIKVGRRRWRVRQLGAAVRDQPEEAAAILKKLGWSVTPPAAPPVPRDEPFTHW